MYCLVQNDGGDWYIVKASNRYRWYTAVEGRDWEALESLTVMVIDNPSYVEFEGFWYGNHLTTSQATSNES